MGADVAERSGGRGRRNRRDAWRAVVGSTRRAGGGDPSPAASGAGGVGRRLDGWGEVVERI